MKRFLDKGDAMARPWLLVAVSAVVVVALAALMTWKPSEQRHRAADRPALVLYCAAGIKPAIEPVARQYEREYRVSLQLQYGGSGTLLSNIRVAKTGDLFLAGDESYIQLGREQGVIAEAIPLARQTPVIAVRAGNPKRIATLADLRREDARVALANPDAASIGSVTRKLLQATGDWEPLEKHVRATGVFKPTVNDIANDIKLGTVDAGILWDSTARQYPDLEMIRLPVLDAAVQRVMIGVLTASQQPTAALRFARYLGARDRGLREFVRQHYEPVEGDEWAEIPDLRLFSGAMLRPAIEKTLKDFETREGVRITTVYNGCGILTAQMRAGERPDAYFACDASFMDSVADMYLTPITVAGNPMVILVAKGNPLGIQSLDDLARPGVRLGLGHPDKSALGALTKRLLESKKLYDALLKNLKVDSATGDFLVNQLRTGSLDAVIVYRSNAHAVREHLDTVEIEDRLAHATQPYAVGRATKYRQLMSRLQAAFVAAESRQQFETAGFHWKAAP